MYVIIGIENQSEIHYAMPVKDMLYDAINYSRQAAAADRQHHNNKEYSRHAEFLSGFKKTDTLPLRKYIQDYKLNLIAPCEITDFEKFKTSLGMVLEVIKYASDEAAMGKLFKENHKFDHIEAEAVRAINAFTRFNVSINDNEEELNMGNAWEDHRMSGVREGLRDGEQKGNTLKLINQTIKKFQKGCSVEQTADMLEESTDTIQSIYDIIASMPDDCSAEKVYELLKNSLVTT